MKYQLVKEERVEGVYVASRLWKEEKEYIAFASETEHTGKTVSIDTDTLEMTEVLDGPGGCMGVIPVPETEGDFLAIQKFYPVFQSEDSEIVWYSKKEKGYLRKVIRILPFTHRIDIVKAYENYYLIACTLCQAKKYTDDWSTSGSVYAGKINFEKKYIEDLRPVYDGIFQNHGFTKIPGKEKDTFLIAGSVGVLEFTPQITEQGMKWNYKKILDFPASDVVIADIDGDGEKEYGIIAPFHGENFQIFKKKKEGMKCIYTLPGAHEFGHAVYGGPLEDKEVFMVGFRAGNRELFVIRQTDGQIGEEIVDAGKGPANVTVVKGKQGDYICAANRQSDLCSVYQITK